jgi:hypothetical protein
MLSFRAAYPPEVPAADGRVSPVGPNAGLCDVRLTVVSLDLRRPVLQQSRRRSNVDACVQNIARDDAARSNPAVTRNRDVGTHNGSRSDEGEVTHLYPAGQHGAWTNMNSVSDDALVVDRRPRIQNHRFAQDRVDAHESESQDLASSSHDRAARHEGCLVYERRRNEACAPEPEVAPEPRFSMMISDRHGVVLPPGVPVEPAVNVFLSDDDRTRADEGIRHRHIVEDHIRLEPAPGESVAKHVNLASGSVKDDGPQFIFAHPFDLLLSRHMGPVSAVRPSCTKGPDLARRPEWDARRTELRADLAQDIDLNE